MYIVKEHITQWRHRLSQHEFFSRLQPDPSLDRALAFAPGLTFWVMTFQDVLRLNAQLAQAPEVRSHLEQHVLEDAGHDRWFLEDLNVIFGDRHRDITWLFGPENVTTRHAAFALVSEVFRVNDDSLRLVLVEAIEAVFQVFFHPIVRYLKESGHDGQLKYFSSTHLAVEANHEMFNADVEHPEFEIELSEQVRHEGLLLVDRVFNAFVQMADGLLPIMEKTERQWEAPACDYRLKKQLIATHH